MKTLFYCRGEIVDRWDERPVSELPSVGDHVVMSDRLFKVESRTWYPATEIMSIALSWGVLTEVENDNKRAGL